jgi:putative oxidoreductase
VFGITAHTGYDWLRILCGVFLLPHAWGKVTSAGPLGFFKAAGFPKPVAFMYLALVIEVLAAIALVFDIHAREVAWFMVVFLLVAGVASLKVSKGNWIWLAGGCEYPVFWVLCCAIVATNG